MERQSHGFVYQENCIKKYNLIKDDNYTGEWDGYWQNKKPVQIKTIKFGSAIDLGDYYRNKGKVENFTLFLGFWKGTESYIVEEYIFEDINKDEWNKLFEYEFDEELKNDLRKITNNYSDDLKWKEVIRKHKSRWNNIKRLVQPRFKRDHKSQKRMQCAINNSDFYKSFIEKFNGKKA
jgi:hypothetical protein